MAGQHSMQGSTALNSHWRRRLATLLLVCLTGCGFHLRGPGEPLSFSRLYLDGNVNAPLTATLQRKLRHYPGLTLVDRADAADVRLQILGEQRERVILSLTTAGRVREVTLRQRLRFQVLNVQGDALLNPDTLLSERVLSTNDTDTLAKESEENQIYQQLEDDAIRLLLLRLQALRMPQASATGTPVPPDAAATGSAH